MYILVYVRMLDYVYVYVCSVCICTGVCSCEFIYSVACCNNVDSFVRSELDNGRFKFVPILDSIHWRFETWSMGWSEDPYLVLTSNLKQVIVTLQYTYTVHPMILTPFGIDRSPFWNHLLNLLISLISTLLLVQFWFHLDSYHLSDFISLILPP